MSPDGGFPSYPYRKVALVGDFAPVGALQYEANENAVYHAEVFSLLCDRRPEIARDAAFTHGWLTQTDDEAVLVVAQLGDVMNADDLERMGHAVRDWCVVAGVCKLTVQHLGSHRAAEGFAKEDWGIP